MGNWRIYPIQEIHLTKIYKNNENRSMIKMDGPKRASVVRVARPQKRGPEIKMGAIENTRPRKSKISKL